MKNLLSRGEQSGEAIEIIYLAESGEITQRCIKVLKMTESFVKAYCFTKRQYRVFKLGNILSAAPARVQKGA